MLALIDSLRSGKEGFNELQAGLGISNKVLSERLSSLEREGLVVREEYVEQDQRRTRYLSTQKLVDLYPLLDAYKTFSKKYGEELVCGDVSCTECPYIQKQKEK